MKRRQKNRILTVSLLPFLLVLACLLGVLILMITGVSLGQMEEDQAPAVVSNSNEYKQIRKENYALQKQIESFEEKLNEEKELKKEFEEANELYEKRLKEYEEVSQKTVDWQKRIIESNNEIASRESSIEKLEGEIKKLNENVQSTQEEIAFRLDPANHPVNKVVNVKDGSIKTPYFMECEGNVLSYIENGTVKKQFKAPLLKNKDFHEFLKKVSALRTVGLVFLVREDGTGIYEEAKKLAIHFSILSGKLPVRGIGEIDTSEFKNTTQEPLIKKSQIDPKILEMLKKKAKTKSRNPVKKNSDDKKPDTEETPTE